MIEGQNFKNGLCDPDYAPFRGWFVIRGLGIITGINIYAKFEVPISTHHVDMIVDTKCRKCGGFGYSQGRSRSLEIVLFDRAHTSSY